MALPFDAVGNWPGHWLKVTCSCTKINHLPLKMLARQHGAETRLPDLVARLKCGTCGGRPASAELVDWPNWGGEPPPRTFY